jgi:hypothetical protein
MTILHMTVLVVVATSSLGPLVVDEVVRQGPSACTDD